MPLIPEPRSAAEYCMASMRVWAEKQVCSAARMSTPVEFRASFPVPSIGSQSFQKPME
jgi:hypothetical protein